MSGGQVITFGGAVSGTAGAVTTASLPPLREELSLFPGARTLDGSPSWVLHDPVAQRYFRIGWREFEVLSRWHLGNVETIVADVHEHSPLETSAQEIDALARFLATHNLLQARGPRAIARLQEQAAKLKLSGPAWLLKNYLFIRIPLLRPDAFLTRTLPYVSWLGTRGFLLLVLCCAFVGLFLAQRNWEGFLATFPYFFSLQGLLMMGIALSGAKVLHELGHAYVAKHFGCKVPTIGVALLVLWPVLYTDATDAWRLTSRRQRLLIDAAGMAVELSLAVFATLLWSFLPDGALRSAVFLLATTTWIVTLLVNLNPFMRFDGYYLLSDLLGIPNLQDRAFAIARWRLREFLFGWGENPPEQFGTRTRRVLYFYAYGTWIYRFFLFLGIAVLVYFLFFKVLGIFLMVVELVWFIGMPFYKEFKVWAEKREHMRFNLQSGRTLALLALLLGLFLFPWQSDVAAPALWRAQQQVQVYTPGPGRVAAVAVRVGDQVSAGQPIVSMASPDLDYEIAQGEKQVQMLQWQTQIQSLDTTLQERSLVSWQELEAETARQKALLQERERLQVTSPIDGVVMEMLEPLVAGDWLAESELLAVIAARETGVVEGWAVESDLNRIEPGVTGRFFPDDIQQASFPVTLVSIDNASTTRLSEEYLASTYGGAIAVRQDAEGALVPERPVYRLQASVDGDRAAPSQLLRGTLHLEGERASVAVRLWRTVYAVLVRESGF